MWMAMHTHRKIYGSHIDPGICGAYRKFTDTHIKNGHFLCVHARAGEEITILHSIYLYRYIFVFAIMKIHPSEMAVLLKEFLRT
jgi:hypothetical protein